MFKLLGLRCIVVFVWIIIPSQRVVHRSVNSASTTVVRATALHSSDPALMTTLAEQFRIGRTDEETQELGGYLYKSFPQVPLLKGFPVHTLDTLLMTG